MLIERVEVDELKTMDISNIVCDCVRRPLGIEVRRQLVTIGNQECLWNVPRSHRDKEGENAGGIRRE